MADNEKKYAGLAALQTFLDNLKNLFATKTSVDELSADVDGKANASHSHAISEVTDLQTNLDTINDTLEQKSQVQVVSEGSSEVLSTLMIHKLTQEEYDQEVANGTVDANAIYLTPEEEIDLSNYATIEQLAGKADLEHSHDDLYYTESEVDTLLSSKADSTHNHDSAYDAFGSAEDAANTALDTAKSYAKEYTDTAVSGLASASSVNTSINTHNTSTDAHNDIRELIADLSTAVNKFLDVDDTTTDQLSEVLTLIENNKGTLESLTTSKINVSDIIDNLTTASTDKVLSANQGVVIQGLIDALQEELDNHTHEIADVSGLQSALDGKQSKITGAAATITNVDLTPTKVLISSSTGKVVASSVDSADFSAVDFSKLMGLTSGVQTQLDAKAATNHTHTVANVTDLTATATELNYMSGVTSSVQTQLDGKAASSHTHDDRYYTESEINTKIDEINASISTSTTEAKSYADTGDATTLESSKTYTDNAVATKTQVQMIIWEDDD